MGRFLVLSGFLAIAACSTAGSSAQLSPREEATQVDRAYAAVLVAAQSAISSPQLQNDAVKNQIKASTNAATIAVLAYHDEAAKCVRIGGTVQDAKPGIPCDPSIVNRLLAGAQGLVIQTGSILAAFGYKPQETK